MRKIGIILLNVIGVIGLILGFLLILGLLLVLADK